MLEKWKGNRDFGETLMGNFDMSSFADGNETFSIRNISIVFLKHFEKNHFFVIKDFFHRDDVEEKLTEIFYRYTPIPQNKSLSIDIVFQIQEKYVNGRRFMRLKLYEEMTDKKVMVSYFGSGKPTEIHILLYKEVMSVIHGVTNPWYDVQKQFGSPKALAVLLPLMNVRLAKAKKISKSQDIVEIYPHFEPIRTSLLVKYIESYNSKRSILEGASN